MPRIRETIKALDSETTGKDFWHGSLPFYVNFALADNQVKFWEWDVDPFTRQVNIPADDLEAILDELNDCDELAIQGAKFDYHSLDAACRYKKIKFRFPWEKVRCTIMAGHLLASSQKHDLTAMTLQRLGVDIQPYEDALEVACKESRTLCRRKQFQEKYGKVRIADAGDPTVPSLKKSATDKEDRSWKYDSWLPRELAKLMGLPESHKWWTVLREYANPDPLATRALWISQKREIESSDLWEIYVERLKLLPIAANHIEGPGITGNSGRQKEIEAEYRDESNRLGSLLTGIASSYTVAGEPFHLSLPKGGANNSLREFCFDVLKLRPIYNPKAKSDQPCLDSKNAIPHYLDTLPAGSKELAFIQALGGRRGKRACDTSLSYLEGYERHWVPLDILNELGERMWYVIHTTMNPTGSVTLRWSSKNPNSQNFSHREEFNLRYILGPLPGREWWACDGENLELRLPAYESGEEALIELFERPNDPPYYGSNHALIAHLLYPKEFESCRNGSGLDGRLFKKRFLTIYTRIKGGNFARQYGAIDRDDGTGTADRTYGIPGAQTRIAARFAKQEELNQYWIYFAQKKGYVETMPDKTVNPRRGYPLWCARSSRRGSFDIKPTVPLNYHIQGTAMQWTNKAMIRTAGYLRGLDARIVLQVHDELVFDFPKGESAEPWETNLHHVQELARLMAEGGKDIGVPTPVSIEYHPDNYRDGVKMKAI